ncbi:diamine acetyltransferase 1-like [Ambystoma mexicanum]|uniref:diamine acetyltransferase 1-like n=1 Tax=Ambystoma mexicanum TaxID=8296 RepID=UPI0037E7F582
MEYNIRLAVKEDCKELLRLIKDMAGHYALAHQVVITEKVLMEDGFTDNPLFKCLVVELPPGQKSEEGFTIIGYLFFYFTYSSWKGRSLCLEDLFVMSEYRGNGIGTVLLRTLAKVCRDSGCCRMQLTVRQEHKRTINMYLDHGAEDVSTTEQWHLLRFDEEALERMAWQGSTSIIPLKDV